MQNLMPVMCCLLLNDVSLGVFCALLNSLSYTHCICIPDIHHNTLFSFYIPFILLCLHHRSICAYFHASSHNSVFNPKLISEQLGQSRETWLISHQPVLWRCAQIGSHQENWRFCPSHHQRKEGRVDDKTGRRDRQGKD